jgi:hypothetical protein
VFINTQLGIPERSRGHSGIPSAASRQLHSLSLSEAWRPRTHRTAQQQSANTPNPWMQAKSCQLFGTNRVSPVREGYVVQFVSARCERKICQADIVQVFLMVRWCWKLLEGEGGSAARSCTPPALWVCTVSQSAGARASFTCLKFINTN